MYLATSRLHKTIAAAAANYCLSMDTAIYRTQNQNLYNKLVVAAAVDFAGSIIYLQPYYKLTCKIMETCKLATAIPQAYGVLSVTQLHIIIDIALLYTV